jgi:hypothetical protein
MTNDSNSNNGVYWTAKIYDEKTDEFFKVRADENGIRVFPVNDEFSLSTFSRFYEFIVEHVDSRAKPLPNNTNLG